jgi:hypothetical protein
VRAIASALIAIKNGYNEQDAKVTAEFFIICHFPYSGDETHINTYDSVYLPIDGFLRANRLKSNNPINGNTDNQSIRRISEQVIEEYAKQMSQTVVIRSYDNGNREDTRSPAEPEEARAVSTAIESALIAIKNGYDEDTAKAAAEFFVGCQFPSEWNEPRINTHDSVYLPINEFLQANQLSSERISSQKGKTIQIKDFPADKEQLIKAGAKYGDPKVFQPSPDEISQAAKWLNSKLNDKVVASVNGIPVNKNGDCIAHVSEQKETFEKHTSRRKEQAAPVKEAGIDTPTDNSGMSM